MCNQSHPHHHHGRFGSERLGRFQPVGRRTFLSGVGKGTFALLTELSVARNIIGIAIGTTGLAACAAPPTTKSSATAPAVATSAPTAPTAAPATVVPAITVAPAASAALPPINYQQVNLSFVNAYVLVRGDEVAVVDTGVANSQAKIEEVIKAVGRSWADVQHVILTHYHPDHAGSMDAVMAAATKAMAYAGAEDIPQIKTTAKLQAVADGQDVFGLQIIATPGHTAGHISVYDPTGSAFITGDAIANDGKLSGPNPQYSSDMVAAIKSVSKIATLRFETAYFMHGVTIEKGASAAIAQLAATLK